MSNSLKNTPLPAEEEISLIDILRFLKGAYKTILVFGISGIAAAFVYLAITPKQFEARVQILMGQINTSYNISNRSPQVINIEEPALLISRLSYPTSFTPEILVACDLQDQANDALVLSNSIKLKIPKGVDNVVELKTFGKSQQVAQDCAMGVFNLIKNSQAQIAAPYIEYAKNGLAADQERLQKIQSVFARGGNSVIDMDVSYLSTRDEIRYLFDEIAAKKNLVASTQNQATRMVAPIYSSDMPITPRKHNIFAAGLFGGLFFGLLIALSRQAVSKLKNKVAGS